MLNILYISVFTGTKLFKWPWLYKSLHIRYLFQQGNCTYLYFYYVQYNLAFQKANKVTKVSNGMVEKESNLVPWQNWLNICFKMGVDANGENFQVCGKRIFQIDHSIYNPRRDYNLMSWWHPRTRNTCQGSNSEDWLPKT